MLITKWMSPDQIELLTGKADADLLRSRTDSATSLRLRLHRHQPRPLRLGARHRLAAQHGDPGQEYNNVRNIVIERQWKKLDKVLHFVDLETGDTRVVPTDWDEERIAQHLAPTRSHLPRRS